MTTVDVVIPAHPKDFPVLRHCVRGVLRHLRPLGRVHIVATVPFPTRDPRVVWVPESSATSLPTSAQLRERWTQFGPAAAGRAGWIYQQILKLGVPEYIPDISAAYMLVDADVIWLRPWRITVDDRIRFPYTQAFEYHPPYRDAYFRLFGVRPQAPFSLTAHQMVYDRDLLAEMKRAIEARHDKRWWEGYVEAADPLEPSSISELDSYGLWVLDNHPAAASHRQLNYLNVPIVPGPLGRAAYARDFNFVAAHAWMRTPRWMRAAQIGAWLARDTLVGIKDAAVASRSGEAPSLIAGGAPVARLRRRLSGDRSAATRVTFDDAEIISGERVQRLAELTIISRQTYEFHRGVAGYAADMLLFERGMDEFDSRAIDRLCNARSLFLYTHDVDEFIAVVWPRLSTRPSVLITHNSDAEVSQRHVDWLDRDGVGVSYWLAQNATVAHPRLHPVPIGIANSMWPHGDIRLLARAARRAQHQRRQPGSLFAQFDAATHPSRTVAAQALRTNFPRRVVKTTPSLKWGEYLSLLGTHQFSACPRGNGIDTHRIWESLYLGVLPIVERTELSSHWSGCGIPLVLIDDWREVTPERLRLEAERLAPAWSRNLLQMSTYRAATEDALSAAGSRPREAHDRGGEGGAARAAH